MCENNDPYRPWLWVGRVDQLHYVLWIFHSDNGQGPVAVAHKLLFLWHIREKFFDPRGRPHFRPVITILTQIVHPYVRMSFCPSVRSSVRPKISKSSDNHCRPDLWAGRVDHWWLLSSFFFSFSPVRFSSFFFTRSLPVLFLLASKLSTFLGLFSLRSFSVFSLFCSSFATFSQPANCAWAFRLITHELQSHCWYSKVY